MTRRRSPAAFASKAPHTEKFREVAFSDRAGVPILDNALAWMACQTRDIHSGGDHEIFVGEVVELGWHDGDPLLFQRGGYLPHERGLAARARAPEQDDLLGRVGGT